MNHEVVLQEGEIECLDCHEIVSSDDTFCIMGNEICKACVSNYQLKYECETCGNEFNNKGLAFECPNCHATNLYHPAAIISAWTREERKKKEAIRSYNQTHVISPKRREAVTPPGKPILASGGVFNHNTPGGVMSNQPTLEGFATVLAAKVHFIKASFGGMPGTGKTTSGSDFVAGAYQDMKCTKPLLYIDNEKGSRFLVPFFKNAGIPVYVKETCYLGDILDAMKLLETHQIDMLFIDSLSKVWYQFVRDYKDANKVKFMSLEHWGKILPEWQERFSDRFAALEASIVFTGRGGFSYSKEDDTKDENGNVTKKGAFIQSGVKMKLAGETPFEPDFNVWMELRQEVKKGKVVQWHEAQVLKDRNRDPKTTLDGKTFKNPTYKDFKPVISFILDTALGEVAGPSNTTNLAPSEDYEYQRRKQAREIELEKIKAEFDKQGLGSSKEDKQLKVLIVEKCFGTSSWAEIEKMEPKGLAIQREVLQQFFRKFEILKTAAAGDTTPIEFAQKYIWELDSELPDFLKATPAPVLDKITLPPMVSALPEAAPVGLPKKRTNSKKPADVSAA